MVTELVNVFYTFKKLILVITNLQKYFITLPWLAKRSKSIIFLLFIHETIRRLKNTRKKDTYIAKIRIYGENQTLRIKSKIRGIYITREIPNSQRLIVN